MTVSSPKPYKEHYTFKDYLQWPDGERWELIRGIPHDMSPAPSTNHQRVSRELLFQIRSFLTDSAACEVFCAPFDVRLPEGQEADDDIIDVVQPDIAVICDPSRIDDRGCRGAPDWIIEILSPRTASMDHIRKRELYEKHGVGEYWLVHPLDHLVTVFIMGQDGKYLAPSYHERKEVLNVNTMDGLSIDLNAVFS